MGLRLGKASIMDPLLAQRHGALYVHMAAVAIDLDRIAHALTDDQETYGTEVFLTSVYLRQHFDPTTTTHRALIEDSCLSVMEREGEIMGGQLPFAVNALVEIGAWENAWPVLFSAWKKPRHLMLRFCELWRHELSTAEQARRYMNCTVSPPIIESTAQFLESLASAKPAP